MTDGSNLDFERAEPESGAAPGIRCAGCGQPVIDAYWQVNAAVACEKCKNALARERATRRPGRFLLAGLLGTLAAAVGAVIWYAVAKATNAEWGLLGIVVGLGVGVAVKKGARGRGGWAYQGLAMFLTYMAIVSSYIPSIVTSFQQRAAEEKAAAAPAAAGAPVRPAAAGAAPAAPAPGTGEPARADADPPSFGGFLVAIVALFGLAMALPFLAGFENIMGLVIIAIALYEAWKLNRAQPLVVTGPFDARAAPGGAAAVG